MTLIVAMLTLLGSASAQTGDYRLGPGDSVKVTIHGVLDGQTLQLSSNGDVSFPYVGSISLDNLTAFEAEERIENLLRDGYIRTPEVSVSIEGYTSQSVEVFGAVGKAGVHVLRGDTTLRSLVAKLGGVDMKRSSGFISVVRGTQTHRFSIDELDSEAGEFILEPSDIVDVEVGNTIFLAGEISKPGATTYYRGLTASQAYLMAGGATQFGRVSRTYIVRGDERITVNIKRVLKGKAADVDLKPGDRMVIPVSPI